MNTNDTGIGARRRWIILGVAYLCIMSYATTLQSVPPVLSLIIADLKLSHTQAGLLMSFFALPGIVLSIPIGMIADRYSQKAIGVVSFALMIGGAAIFASGSSLPMLALGRVVSGVGAITIFVLAPQLLSQWFAGRETGIAMGVFHTGVPLGTILALNFLALLGERLGWQASVWLSIGVPLVALVIFAFLLAPPPQTGHRTSSQSEGFFQGIKLVGTPIWIIGVAWMLFNATAISLFTFNPDFLKTAGFSVALAGFITSAVMWPALVISPVIGYIIYKLGRKRAIVITSSVVLTILMLLVPTATSWALVLMLLIGVAVNLTPTPTFTLVPEVTRPERLGLAFGIISTCHNLGVVAGPAAVGAIRDVTGSYQASYTLMAGFAILIALAMIILGWRRHLP